ncbi:uncharacterized protein LOC127677878 [Apodemus sylvaticus]|uniref:uncharacterized protein LOC127677878 n=1 Tax=Apodemus sylvaticus TaxID=10129 RepID=UPI002244F32A|nr:uncharacterized protein LOC127677878 [Apodemus sylvaticus]
MAVGPRLSTGLFTGPAPLFHWKETKLKAAGALVSGPPAGDRAARRRPARARARTQRPGVPRGVAWPETRVAGPHRARAPRLRDKWPLPSRQRPARRVARSARPEGRRGSVSRLDLEKLSEVSRRRWPVAAGWRVWRAPPPPPPPRRVQGAQKSPEQKRSGQADLGSGTTNLVPRHPGTHGNRRSELQDRPEGHCRFSCRSGAACPKERRSSVQFPATTWWLTTICNGI